jgi:DNA-binding XRE family transcriptional regulator
MVQKRWNMIRKRAEADLTQKDLAEKLGRPRMYIVNIENGHAEPKASDALKIASALGTTVEELFG